MCNKKFTKKVYDYLAKHTAELGREKEQLVKEYYTMKNFRLKFLQEHLII